MVYLSNRDGRECAIFSISFLTNIFSSMGHQKKSVILRVGYPLDRKMLQPD